RRWGAAGGGGGRGAAGLARVPGGAGRAQERRGAAQEGRAGGRRGPPRHEDAGGVRAAGALLRRHGAHCPGRGAAAVPHLPRGRAAGAAMRASLRPPGVQLLHRGGGPPGRALPRLPGAGHGAAGHALGGPRGPRRRPRGRVRPLRVEDHAAAGVPGGAARARAVREGDPLHTVGGPQAEGGWRARGDQLGLRGAAGRRLRPQAHHRALPARGGWLPRPAPVLGGLCLRDEPYPRQPRGIVPPGRLQNPGGG
ncbi:unnamed protein product, partial [Prorocentrum cordatum]